MDKILLIADNYFIMFWNRWQCWILSLFTDFSGHNFYVENVAGRGTKVRVKDGVEDDEGEEPVTGYVLHCVRCAKHNLFLTTNADLKVGEKPEVDAFRIPV